MSISDAEKRQCQSVCQLFFQNCISRDSLRFYGWGGSSANGTFSINEFAFNGL
jgi:hypothetical protein